MWKSYNNCWYNYFKVKYCKQHCCSVHISKNHTLSIFLLKYTHFSHISKKKCLLSKISTFFQFISAKILYYPAFISSRYISLSYLLSLSFSLSLSYTQALRIQIKKILNKIFPLTQILKMLLPLVTLMLSQAILAAPLPKACPAYPDLVGPLPNFTQTVAQSCSYAGFAPMDSNNNSALFYWYFPNEKGDPNAPLLIWLQGGPGASSLWGAFTEHLGPFTIVDNGDGGQRVDHVDGSWASAYNMLFIDNPLGTGYSYSSNGNYSTDIDQVS